jgi:hypothetical protein
MNTLKWGAATLALAMMTTPAFAHHPGGAGNVGGAGPINTLPGTTMGVGEKAVSLTYEYGLFGGLSDYELTQAAAAHQHAHTLASIHSLTLGMAWGVTDNFTLMASMPYVARTDVREGHHSHGPSGNTVDYRGDVQGVGDLTLLGQYNFYNDYNNQLAVSALAGLKLNSGEVGKSDKAGEEFNTEFQPGSGSIDPLLGVAVSKGFGNWSLHGNLLYAFAGDGFNDTNLGDRLHYNAAVAYRFGGEAQHEHAKGTPEFHDHSLWTYDAVLELNGEWQDYEREGEVSNRHSGGNVIFLSPGFRVSFGDVAGQISLGLPIHADMNGIQSPPGARLRAGISWAF